MISIVVYFIYQLAYFFISALIFSIAGFLHIVRAFYGWDLVIGEVRLPITLSWALGVVTIFMVYHGYTFGKKTKK